MTKDGKINILVLGDSFILPSGVANVIRNIVDPLAKSGMFQIFALGGAIKHQNYQPMKFQEYGDSVILYPVDDFGTKDLVRQMIWHHKIDVVLIVSDPRFYIWFWEIENEIRQICPIIYHHVWDNYDYPTFNNKYYVSNDLIVTISKVTSDIVRKVSPDIEEMYLPHVVDPKIFHKLPEDEIKKYKETSFNGLLKDKFVFFWNNRNARRKNPGSIIWWFADWIQKYNLKDKVCLLMHTEPISEHGTDIPAILEERGLINGEVILSVQKLPPEQMNILYNMADCTINCAHSEGFGISSSESLATQTPIINNMTGGLQEQVTDGTNWFGVGIYPSSKMHVGSPLVPWIREDHISQDDFENALGKMFNMPKEERGRLGELGLQHLKKNYNFKEYGDKWIQIMNDVYDKYGSWDTRKNYAPWKLEEVII